MDQNPHLQSTPVSHRNPHNPPAENQKNKPSKMDQNPHQNRRLALSKMDQNGITLESTPRLEQQDRRLRWRWRERETRSTPPKASGGDGERHSTLFNPKPTDQVHSTQKQRETKEEKAIGGGSGDGNQRKLEEEIFIRREEERKSCALKRERELKVRYKEEREKMVKKLYAHATVPCIFARLL